jgi:hypothetical protein
MFVQKHSIALTAFGLFLVVTFAPVGRAVSRSPIRARDRAGQEQRAPSPPPGVHRISAEEQHMFVVQQWLAPGGPCDAGQWGLAVSPGSSLARELKTETIVVSGPRPDAPDGFLRRIVSVAQMGGQLIFCTTQASLEDTHVTGVIERNIPLGIAYVASSVPLVPGVVIRTPSPSSPSLRRVAEVMGQPVNPPPCAEASRGFEVEMNRTPWRATADIEGALEVCPQLSMVLSYSFGHIRRLRFDLSLDESARVELTAAVRGQWKGSKDIANIRFQPIVAELGGIPVVLRPVVTVFLAGEASGQSNVKTGALQHAWGQALVDYDGQNWNRKFSSQPQTISLSPPTISAGSVAKGELGARLELEVYGTVGPYFQPTGYIEADYSTSAGCSLQVGLEGPVGVDLKIFGHLLKRQPVGNLFDLNQSRRCH